MRLLNCFILFCYFSFQAQTYKVFFGNLHSHTGFSDGCKDSSTSGISRPSGAYSYAKLTNDFDFLGISEHNHYSTAKNPGFKLPLYAEGLNMSDAANEEGKFLALFGMEYGISSSHNGHVIIYGYNQLIGWETNVAGNPGNNYDLYNGKNDYVSLFKKIRNNPNAFCYLAHPYWTDFTLDGTDSTALAFMPYNAQFDSAIVGIPLRSGNAFSTFTDYSDYAPGNYFNYYKLLLYKGYHIGIGYDHDNHYTNFGRSNGGRLAVLLPSLTRVNLYKAMQNMNFYGTDDRNAEVEFTLGQNIMGSIIKDNYYPSLNVFHKDPDGEIADTIRIWRGNANSGGLWAEIIKQVTLNNVCSITDTDIIPGVEYYYFADMRQADGHWIVTSPIWYTADETLTLPGEELKEAFSFYPNPVSGAVNLSFKDANSKEIEITDLTGRTITKMKCRSAELKIDLRDFSPGVFF
jgi:hypothetical protein